MAGKSFRPRSNATFCSIWSGLALFVQAWAIPILRINLVYSVYVWQCLSRNNDTIFVYIILFLAHLSRSDKMRFCDHILSVVRASLNQRMPPVCKQFLQTTSSKPLIRFWPNFTGMILGWSFFKVVQMVPVHCTSRSRAKIDIFTENLKYLLVWNRMAQVFDIWFVASSNGPLPKMFKL